MFFNNWVKNFLKSLIGWYWQEDRISEVAVKSSSFEDYLRRLMDKHDKPAQKIALRLSTHFYEQLLVVTYEICLPEKVPFLIKLKPALNKNELGDLLWQLQGEFIDKEIYPFGREFPPLRNFVIGVRNIILHGGLEKFHDAKLMSEILKKCCLALGISAAVENELEDAVDTAMTESIPLAERILTFKKANEFVEAVAAREP